MRQTLTKTIVDALTPGSLVWDASVRGFAVRRQRDARVYLTKYRSADGRQRWYRIGQHGSPWTPDTARKEAVRILGLVATGQDPAGLRIDRRADPTVSALCDRFISDHVDPKLKPTSAKEYRRLITTVIKPKLGALVIRAVTADDVARLHHVHRGTPYAANRVLAVLGKMFALAERWGYRGQHTNPARGLEKFAEKKRKRYLTAAELTRLLTTLDDAVAGKLRVPGSDAPVMLSVYAVAALRLLVHTGARVSEIRTLRWDAVDLKRGALHLHDSKTGPKTIMLSDAACAVLAALPKHASNPHVIVGDNPGAPLVNLADAWDAVRRVARLGGVRMHDIRHSYASFAVDAGLSLPTIGGLLGHASSATTKRYAHIRDELKAHAAEQVGARISQIMAKNQHG